MSGALLGPLMQRRTFITAVGTAGLVGLAGCSGGIPDDLEFTAEPATVEQAVATDAGYEPQETTPLELNESIDVAGETREINITTWTTGYQSDTGPFIVLSTPNVEIAGQSLNPLARLSGSELIGRLLEEAGGGDAISDLEPAGETEITVFDESATVEEFTATLQASAGSGSGSGGGDLPAAAENGEIPIRLYLLSVTHETGTDSSDVVFALTFHPQEGGDPETVYTLFESLQHPVSPPASADQ